MRTTNAIAWLAAAALAAAAGTAQAQMDPKKLSDKLGKDYGVQVLKVVPVEMGATPAFAVTVMNKGGNANEAFAVTTLVVDRQKGELLSQFRHIATGYLSSGAEAFEANRNALTTPSDGKTWR
jgi:hypothetical protein